MIGQTHIVALSGGLCLFKTPEPKNAAGISARIDQPETATVARKALERISRRHNSYRCRIHLFDRTELLNRHVFGQQATCCLSG